MPASIPSPTLSSWPLALAALCVWREARNQPVEAMTGVWNVIKNRVNDSRGRWPKTIVGVIVQPLQFSSFNRNDPNASQIPLQSETAWQECCAVVDGNDADPTGGANAYHSLGLMDQLPAWADPQKQTVRLGAFTFYKL